MKKILSLSLIAGFLIAVSLQVSSCTVSKKIQDKSGAQLWGENCSRCHNAPGPGEFSNANWDIIAMHMRVRANLTGEETSKIMAFLKGS